MEKPLLTLTTKDFITGLSYGAHIGRGGLFYKADGVTPFFDAGTAQSKYNGLLMAGGQPTTISGSLNGNVISSTQYTNASDTTFYFGTSTSHIFSLVASSTFATSLTDAHTASNLRHGLETFRSTDGSNMLFYFMDTAIGRYDFSSWNDSWKAISTDDIHATHSAFDRIYFGNSSYIGVLFDDGAGLATSGAGNTTTNAFSIVRYGNCTDISDDGLFLIIATTQNYTNNPNALSGCNILFWDTYSSLPARVYEIPDPYIFALEKTSQGVFAVGTTGIWQVSYGSEPRKVFSISPSIYSNQTSSALKYGKGAVSNYADALVWGGSSGTVKTFGRLQTDAPNAYLHPFITSGTDITLVDGQLLKGYVFVADQTPRILAYPLKSSATPNTGVYAQTAYIPLPTKVAIKRVDLVFGEPLASGDSMSVALYSDEATASTSSGTASYAADGDIRRKQLPQTLTVEDQLSIRVNFDAGAVKLKAIEVWGEPMTL